MTKREILIQQVTSGTNAIHNNGTIEQLREVLGWCFPDDDGEIAGANSFYENNAFCDGHWDGNNYTSIPTISVKEFYEDEVKDTQQWVRNLLNTTIDFRSYQSIRHGELLDVAIEVANVKINETAFTSQPVKNEDEFVWGEEVEVRNRHTWFNRLYVGKNPKNNLFLCVDEDGNPNEWLHIRKLPTKLKLTSQMIADKFNTTIDGYEIVNDKK